MLRVRWMIIGLCAAACFWLLPFFGASAREGLELSLIPGPRNIDDVTSVQFKFGDSSQSWMPRLVFTEGDGGADPDGSGDDCPVAEALGLVGYRAGVGTGLLRWQDGQSELEMLGLDYQIVVGNRQGGALLYYADKGITLDHDLNLGRDHFGVNLGGPSWDHRQGSWGWELDGRVRRSKTETLLWETGWRHNLDVGHSEAFIGSGLELRQTAQGKVILGSRFTLRESVLGWLARLNYEEKKNSNLTWIGGLEFESWSNEEPGAVFSSLWQHTLGEWNLGVGGRLPWLGTWIGWKRSCGWSGHPARCRGSCPLTPRMARQFGLSYIF